MKFPVDLLADVSLAELEQSAHNYMNNLLYSNPDSSEHLTISASTKVIIDISSVGFIPLYGSDDTWKILALFSPSDPFIAVGLYLLDRWWAVEDILKTADPARDGVLEVGVSVVSGNAGRCCQFQSPQEACEQVGMISSTIFFSVKPASDHYFTLDRRTVSFRSPRLLVDSCQASPAPFLTCMDRYDPCMDRYDPSMDSSPHSLGSLDRSFPFTPHHMQHLPLCYQPPCHRPPQPATSYPAPFPICSQLSSPLVV